MEKHPYVQGARRQSPPDVHRPQLSLGTTNDDQFNDEAPPVYELNLGSQERNVATTVLSTFILQFLTLGLVSSSI